MDWIPIGLLTFKLLVLGIGMFYAIKWHYDQGKKDQNKIDERRAVLRASGKASLIFVLGILAIGLFAFTLSNKLGLDLTFP